MSERFDVAVIGLGAMGAAALYQLARRGVRAIGLDRFNPPHALGSTHGETRITRVGVGEGAAYAPFARRSHAIWRTLEAETGEDLLTACGLIVLGTPGLRAVHHGKDDFTGRSAAVAEQCGVAHELLDAAQIAARFPMFELRGDEIAYFELGGGFVDPERAVAAQLSRAAALGATIRTGVTVTGLDNGAIATDAGPVQADQVIVSAGAWAGKLLGAPFAAQLVPYRQVLHWFPVDTPTAWAAGTAPAYIWLHGDGPQDYFYGFPARGGVAEIKVATEQYAAACDPDTVSRHIDPAEPATMHAAHIAGRLRGVSPIANRSATCLYTVTGDAGFVIDRHPAMGRVMVVSACSGHGFKHSAAIGEAVAEQAVTGRSTIDLAPFCLARLETGRAA